MRQKETIEEYMDRMRLFIPNRQRFPAEELVKFTGKCIAWSPDGTSIVACADDYDGLFPAIEAAGYDPSLCVVSYIDGESTI